MERTARTIALTVLAAFFACASLRSGESGKIAGKVTDKVNGEALPAANIVIAGTTMGAAANLEGQFTIIGVPPGVYTLHVSLVGYTSVAINDVRVFIDQTARVDVGLSSSAIEGKEIVVVAERPVIKRDVATSVTAVTEQEISSLPVTGVVSAIGLQAGIRGGWGGPPGSASQPSFVST